jgi:hypothetical protein
MSLARALNRDALGRMSSTLGSAEAPCQGRDRVRYSRFADFPSFGEQRKFQGLLRQLFLRSVLRTQYGEMMEVSHISSQSDVEYPNAQVVSASPLVACHH